MFIVFMTFPGTNPSSEHLSWQLAPEVLSKDISIV